MDVEKRRFVKASGAVLALMAAPTAVAPAFAQAKTAVLSGPEAALFQQMAWRLFPIKKLPGDAYTKVIADLDAQAKAKGWFAGLLKSSAAAMNKAAGGDFAKADAATQIKAIQAMQKVPSPFFFFVRDTTVRVLFNDRRLWKMIGYEGSSMEHGGYINRGFDDIDWLPKQ